MEAKYFRERQLLTKAKYSLWPQLQETEMEEK